MSTILQQKETKQKCNREEKRSKIVQTIVMTGKGYETTEPDTF